MVLFETFFLSWSLQSERTLAACVVEYNYGLYAQYIHVYLCVYMWECMCTCL